MKITTLLFALFITSFSFSQNRFTVGILQDFSSTMPLNSETKYNADNLHFSSSNLRISFAHNTPDFGAFEFFTYYSILPDKYNITYVPGVDLESKAILEESVNGSTISRSYISNKMNYTARSFGIGANLYKEVSQYFAIGSGVLFTYRTGIASLQTSQLGYEWNGTNYVQNSQTDVETEQPKQKWATVSMPILLKFYLPMKTHRICLSSATNFSFKYINQQIGFTFEF